MAVALSALVAGILSGYYLDVVQAVILSTAFFIVALLLLRYSIDFPKRLVKGAYAPLKRVNPLTSRLGKSNLPLMVVSTGAPYTTASEGAPVLTTIKSLLAFTLVRKKIVSYRFLATFIVLFLVGLISIDYRIDSVKSVSVGSGEMRRSEVYDCSGKMIGGVRKGKNKFYFNFELKGCKSQEEKNVDARGRLRLYMPYDPVISSDAEVQVRFKPFKSNRSSDDFLLKNRVGLSGWVYDIWEISEGNENFSNFFSKIRGKIEGRMVRVSSKDDFAVSDAILLGNQSLITKNLRKVFSDSGLAHILSISGLHVALFALFVGIMVRIVTYIFPSLILSTPRQFYEAVVSIPAVWCYLAIADFPVSGVRAGIMISIYLIGIIYMKKRNVFGALQFAVIVILIVDPLSVFSVSLQLSVVGVFSILLAIPLSTWIKSRWGRLSYPINMLIVSSFATIGTLPIVSYYFGKFTFAGILANLLAIPISGILQLPCLVLGVIFWFIEPLSLFFFYLGSSGSYLIVEIARFSSERMGLLVFEHKPKLFEVILIYAAMSISFLLMKRFCNWSAN